MSNCNCQENIDDDETTVATTVAEKPIGDWLLITAVATMTVGIFFGLEAISAAQCDALLTSTLFVWLMSFLYQKR